MCQCEHFLSWTLLNLIKFTYTVFSSDTGPDCTSTLTFSVNWVSCWLWSLEKLASCSPRHNASACLHLIKEKQGLRGAWECPLPCPQVSCSRKPSSEDFGHPCWVTPSQVRLLCHCHPLIRGTCLGKGVQSWAATGVSPAPTPWAASPVPSQGWGSWTQPLPTSIGFF